MRIVAARMNHETNTFSPVPTPLSAFGPDGPTFGSAALDAAHGTRTALGAFIDACGKRGAQLEVAVNATANPSGPVDDDAYERFAGADRRRRGQGLRRDPPRPARRDGDAELRRRRRRAAAPDTRRRAGNAARRRARPPRQHHRADDRSRGRRRRLQDVPSHRHVRDRRPRGARCCSPSSTAERGRRSAWVQLPLLCHTLRSATGEGAMQRAVERAQAVGSRKACSRSRCSRASGLPTFAMRA